MSSVLQDVLLETEIRTKLIIDGCEEIEGEPLITKVRLENADLSKFKRKLVSEEVNHILNDMAWYNNYNGNLTANQYAIVNAIKRYNIRFFFLNGGGGAGKTEFLKSFILAFGFDLTEHSLFWAPTGKAADVAADKGFASTTFHSFTQWQVSNDLFEYNAILKKIYGEKFEDLINDSNSDFSIKMASAFKGKKFICIDEMSMITKDQMTVILEILNRFMESDAIALFSGDYMQLPPTSVKGFKILPSGSTIEDLRNVGKLQIINFEKRYRSIQQEMNDFCTMLRNGEFQDKSKFYEACNYLKTIKVLPQLNKSNIEQFVDYTFITYTNSVRNSINELCFEYFLGDTYSVKEIKVAYTGPNEEVLRQIRSNMSFESEFEFKVGMHVMFSTNDKDVGFVNGEHGTIKGVILDDSGEVNSISVERFSREKNAYEILDVVRKDYKADVLKQDQGYNVWFKQFPLELAHAMTIHKSQGSGYEKLIIDLSGIDSLPDHMSMLRFRLFYTAITRTIDTEHLYFHGVGSDFFDCKIIEDGSENRDNLYKRYILKPNYSRLTFGSGFNLPGNTPILIDF